MSRSLIAGVVFLRVACGIAVSLLLPTFSAFGQRLHPQEVFKKVAPSVFVLEALSRDGQLLAQGSAVAIKPGLVATNCHLIDDERLPPLDKLLPVRPEGYTAGDVIERVSSFASKPRKEMFMLRQGKKTWGTTVVLRWVGDVCLLAAIGPHDFVPAQPRWAESLEVGESVFAVGAPQGLELTMSEGIISRLEAKDWSIPQIPEKMIEVTRIQTTAAIGPGSSGGGLFDGDGRLIGITTSTLEQGQNLNFAIPADSAYRVLGFFMGALQPEEPLEKPRRRK